MANQRPFRPVTAVSCALALLLTGCGSQAAPPTTITVTSAAPTTIKVPTTVPTTVQVTVTPPAVTITQPVTVTAAAPAANADAGGPKANGNYLVGPNIAPGTWQCSSGDDTTFWRISDQTAKTIDNGFSTIAIVSAEAYTTDLQRCKGTWTKVG